MTRDELIQLVERIKGAQFASEEESIETVELLERHVPDPNVSDLIFYNELTAEEIVDRALSYKLLITPPAAE